MLTHITRNGGRYSRDELVELFGYGHVSIAEDLGIIRYDDAGKAWRTMWS